MVHVAELNAAGTITEVGIDETAEPPLTTDNDTGVSFATEPVSVTRPVAFRPPWKVLGETDVDASCGGSTVSVVPVLKEPSVAVTVASSVTRYCVGTFRKARNVRTCGN